MTGATVIRKWSFFEKLAVKCGMVFMGFYLLTDAFQKEFFPHLNNFLFSFSERLAAWTGKTFFHFSPAEKLFTGSDSAGFYMHTINLLIISIIAGLVWNFSDRKRLNNEKLLYWLFAVMRYYLGFMMLFYGFDKVIKLQFYFPEPNTLFTPIGKLPHGSLYWST